MYEIIFYCKTKIKYFICFLCLKSVFSSFMLEAMKEVLWWGRCGQNLSTVDESCIPQREVALWTVNGSSLACYPSPTLRKLKLISLRNSYIVIGLREEPANFYREKRSVTFVTRHLFTFVVVLSLFCLVTTRILICENQTIWRLEILLRMIVAALLKAKCNGCFVENKGYQETDNFQ